VSGSTPTWHSGGVEAPQQRPIGTLQELRVRLFEQRIRFYDQARTQWAVVREEDPAAERPSDHEELGESLPGL
jgi:hypothetical protein